MVIKEKGLENHYPKFGTKVLFKNLPNPSSKCQKWWKMGYSWVLKEVTVSGHFTLRERGPGPAIAKAKVRLPFANADQVPRTRLITHMTLRERGPGPANAMGYSPDPSRTRTRSREREEGWSTHRWQQLHTKTQTPKWPSGFVRNPVNTNQICHPTKFDVLDSMEPSEF